MLSGLVWHLDPRKWISCLRQDQCKYQYFSVLRKIDSYDTLLKCHMSVMESNFYVSAGEIIKIYITWSAWVNTQCCDYWCPGAEAPGHHYPQPWLNINCIGPVLYRNITVIGNTIMKQTTKTNGCHFADNILNFFLYEKRRIKIKILLIVKS